MHARYKSVVDAFFSIAVALNQFFISYDCKHDMCVFSIMISQVCGRLIMNVINLLLLDFHE